MSAKNIIANHAAEFGLGESAQVDLLCNYIDSRGELEALQVFVDEHASELENADITDKD